jgi:membrane associated rhomboid family serine protease
MILLPYGHEHTTVRRLPWVTLGIMILCLVAFILSGRWRPVAHEDWAIEENAAEAIDWYLEHPYLELDAEFQEVFLSDAGDEHMREMFGYLGEFQQHRPSRQVVLAEQEHLDRLTSRAVEGLRNHTLHRWGLVAAEPKPASWLTHMFLHAGWMHLLGNMLILFLAGPFVEDVWGRPLYLGFYLASGLVAAFFQILSGPDSTVPMIGASGAIAGVMGAFLMRYGRTKIKFFYLFLLIRGTFRAPAWLMIPLWFASQLWMGLLTSELDVQGGVAYWAHIGGFFAGVGTAWLISANRIEERYIHANIESKITFEVKENEDVIEALAARGDDPDKAFRMLSLAVMNNPGNHDAAAALWELAREFGRTEEAAPLMLRSVTHQLRAGDRELALNQWLDVPQHAPRLRGDPRQLVRLAQALLEDGARDDAFLTLRMALQSGGDELDAMLALTIARCARDLDPSTARAAAEHVLAVRHADPDVRSRAEQLLTELPPETGPSIPLSAG